jgi:hypothetical protein
MPRANRLRFIYIPDIGYAPYGYIIIVEVAKYKV